MKGITTRPFGTTEDGSPVWEITITNAHGASVSVLSYGCTLRAIQVPDRNGQLRDVCLGYRTLEEYVRCPGYLGATVGRCANRIAGGRLPVGERVYQLFQNEGENTLHGGRRGFDKYVWDYAVKGDRVVFSRISPDGEEQFPGALQTEVSVRFTDEGTLLLDYSAVCERDTVVNLTNHVYLNLSGDGAGDVRSHELRLRSSSYTPAGTNLLPTGEILPSAGTPYDFSHARAIGCGPDAGGYDTNFVLDAGDGAAAVLFSPDSGIALEMNTDLPGVQIYTGGGLCADQISKSGAPYAPFGGVCLETQFYPDAVHFAAFPSPVLRAGETYRHFTSYRFYAR